MTRQELLNRFSAKEDNFVERKSEGIKPAEIRKSLTAFSNSLPAGREAIVFIGIHDQTGAIEGCGNPDQVQHRVREAGNECYPPILPTCEVLSIDGKDVVAVCISPSQDRPHFAGPAFIRVGSASVKASKVMFDELVYSRNSKVAAILSLKNEVVYVVGLGHRLGQTRRDVERGHREGAECRVVDCNAHYVTLSMLGTGVTFSEDIERVSVGRDHSQDRPQLTITGI